MTATSRDDHYLIKTSNSLELNGAVKASSDFWAEKPLKRGQLWDDLINGHKSGKGVLKGDSLGKNFPVADRILRDEKILVSTKSLDVSLKGYQNPKKLEKVLNKYADTLKNFENSKYFDINDVMTWGGKTLEKSEYNKKVVEIILPDTIITEDSLKVLENFKNTIDDTTDSYGNALEVWYRIGK